MVNKTILGLATMGQSVALAAESFKLAKKKKKKPKDFIKTGVTTIVGANLLKAQANIIAKM